MLAFLKASVRDVASLVVKNWNLDRIIRRSDFDLSLCRRPEAEFSIISAPNRMTLAMITLGGLSAEGQNSKATYLIRMAMAN